MLLIPAIDLKDGHCVRLEKGDMNVSTTFGEDPAAMARRWVDAGARRLHLVDLNGAFAGKPVNEGAFANDIYWVAQGQGMTPYSWPTPDGFPEEDVPWSSPGRALDSLNVQRELSQQWWPTEDAQFPSDKSWCPDLPAKFGDVVDFMGKRMLGKAPTPRLRDAMAQRVGIPLTQRVTWDDLQYEVKFMLMILLGSPAHMTR